VGEGGGGGGGGVGGGGGGGGGGGARAGGGGGYKGRMSRTCFFVPTPHGASRVLFLYPHPRTTPRNNKLRANGHAPPGPPRGRTNSHDLKNQFRDTIL